MIFVKSLHGAGVEFRRKQSDGCMSGICLEQLLAISRTFCGYPWLCTYLRSHVPEHQISDLKRTLISYIFYRLVSESIPPLHNLSLISRQFNPLPTRIDAGDESPTLMVSPSGTLEAVSVPGIGFSCSLVAPQLAGCESTHIRRHTRPEVYVFKVLTTDLMFCLPCHTTTPSSPKSSSCQENSQASPL